MLPQGEDAKRLAVIEDARRASSPGCGSSASEPLVAIGGGALGDAAGFLAATYLRGVPVIHVPDDARRPDRLVDRRQDRGGPARGQEPRRGVPPAGRGRSSMSRPCGRCPSGSGGRRSARRSRWPRSATSGCSSCSRRDGAGDRRAARRRPSNRASSPRSSSAAPGPRSRSSSPTSASGTRAAGGSRSTSGTRSATPSRRPAATAGCSTARRSRTGCAPPPDRRRAGVTPPERAERIGRPARHARARPRAAPLPARDGPRPPRDRQEARRRARCAGSCRPRTASTIRADIEPRRRRTGRAARCWPPASPR